MVENQAKVWLITVGGKSVKVEDLPLRDVDRIAKQAETTWFAVCNTPMLDLLVGADLVEAAAKHLGVEVPENLTPRSLVDFFSLIPDDVPANEESGELDPFDPSGLPSETPGSP